MGYFSWTCAKTKKPILAPVNDWFGRNFSKVVVVRKDGKTMEGSYDGYGRVECDDFTIEDVSEKINIKFKLVLQSFYNEETFAELGKNERDPRQGFFFEDQELIQIFGSPPEEELLRMNQQKKYELFFDELKALMDNDKTIKSNCMTRLCIAERPNALIYVEDHDGKIYAGLVPHDDSDTENFVNLMNGYIAKAWSVFKDGSSPIKVKKEK
jgi:hypothetical protein